MESDETAPTIVGVGIRMPGGKLYQLPCPNRHHNIIHQICSETGEPVPGNAEQGFITNTGQFVSRYVAHRLALKCQQPCKRPIGYGSELYSEDVW